MTDIAAQKLAQLFPPDPSFYKPTEEEVQWLKKVIGIEDDEELKKHALAIRTEGLAVSW